MFDTPLLLVFPFAMAFAGAMDLVSMTIPNRVSLALVAAFAVTAAWAGLPLTLVGTHLAAGFLVLTLGIGMFAAGWVGGGDAKIVAAGALWLGLDQTLPFLLFTGVFGSLLAVLMVGFRSYPVGALPVPQWAARLHRTETGLPYGLAISAAALTVYPHSSIFLALLGL